MQGVTGFSGSQRLHYQKPRTDLNGFKWRDSTAGGDDEMPPLMSPSAPARAEPTAAAPSMASMAVGTPVKLKGLNGPKHLNGCTGRIIGQEESRYQVELTDGSEAGKIKALKPQNLEVGLRSAPAPVPRQFSQHFSVGSRVRLVGLETRPEMNHRVGSIVAVQGSRYHVRLEDGEEGDQDKLMKARNLELVTQPNGPSASFAAPAPTAPTVPTVATAKASTPAAVTPAPKAVAAPKAAVPAAVQRVARPAPKLRDVLKAAKPSWTEKDLTNVVEKLLKAQVTGFAELRDALRATGSAALNERLRAANQKVFAAETVAALKTRVDLEDPPKPVIEMNPDLPKQRWEVIHDLAMIRDAPSLGARAVARKDKGEIIESVEETFDGFLKLPNEAGWCSKDCQGKLGLGELLQRLGPSPTMAVNTLTTSAGPQPFEVVFHPSVAVRSAPSTSASIISARGFGEVVLAETQTYHGWLRLEDAGGWMMCQHPQHGVLLKPAFPASASRLPASNHSNQASKTQATISQNPPEASANAAQAEQRLREQREAEQRMDQKRREEEAARAAKLREQQEAERRKAQQEQEMIRREAEAKQRAEEEKAQAALAVQLAAEQEQLLEAFAEAAASGDPSAIKKARDAAKKGGVPTKEIARVFALAQAQRPAE